MATLNEKKHKDGSVTVRAPYWLIDPGIFHRAILIAYPVDEWRCTKGIDMDWLGRWTVSMRPITDIERQEWREVFDGARDFADKMEALMRKLEGEQE